MQSVIKFLNAQSIAPIEIRRQLCQDNIMSKQMVHRWCRQFTAGRQHLHDEEHRGRSSIIMDDLVWECIMENYCFTITEVCSHFLLLVAQNCYGAPVVQKIVFHGDAKATDIRIQSKVHGVSIDISAAVP